MSEDLNKLREITGYALERGLTVGEKEGRWTEFYRVFTPYLAYDLIARLQAVEERAEKLEGAMLNVQQQCENIVFNLRQADSVSLSNKEAVTIFDRMATTLRVAALKTEGA